MSVALASIKQLEKAMIDPRTFTIDHINGIRERDKGDPALIERSIFALGLLEAIHRSELPFIFKGGSALMLLTEKPLFIDNSATDREQSFAYFW